MDGLVTLMENYHYEGCGLDYVYLQNGYTIHETKHGRGVSIKDARNLHQAIAREVIQSAQPLRGQEVRFIRSVLSISQKGLAQILRQKRGSVARWEAEAGKKIPGAADSALRMFYALKDQGHEVIPKLLELLAELDELEHANHVLTSDQHKRTQFSDTDEGWIKMAA